MPIFSGFVLFAFIWFLTLLVVLPLRLQTQGEAGEVTPGTPQSAPAHLPLRRKFAVTTVAALLVWGVVVTVIVRGWITIQDIESFNARLRLG